MQNTSTSSGKGDLCAMSDDAVKKQYAEVMGWVLDDDAHELGKALPTMDSGNKDLFLCHALPFPGEDVMPPKGKEFGMGARQRALKVIRAAQVLQEKAVPQLPPVLEFSHLPATTLVPIARQVMARYCGTPIHLAMALRHKRSLATLLQVSEGDRGLEVEDSGQLTPIQVMTTTASRREQEVCVLLDLAWEAKKRAKAKEIPAANNRSI